MFMMLVYIFHGSVRYEPFVSHRRICLNLYKPRNLQRSNLVLLFLLVLSYWATILFMVKIQYDIITARNGVRECNVFSRICLSTGGSRVQTCSLGSPGPPPPPRDLFKLVQEKNGSKNVMATRNGLS